MYNHQQYIDDNKPKPHSRFKVGDWVVYTGRDGHMARDDGKISRVTDIEGTALMTDISGYAHMIRDFKLWKPTAGEFVVLWDTDSKLEYYGICRFKAEVSTGIYVDEDDAYWDNIAPLQFIQLLKNLNA